MITIIEELGYDGIIDNSVQRFGMAGMDEDTRHYIVFKAEQIKYTTNPNPTKNIDIRYRKGDGIIDYNEA